MTLPAFSACLLLHSDGLALSLLERDPVDGYADRLVREAYRSTAVSTMRFKGCLSGTLTPRSERIEPSAIEITETADKEPQQ